MKIGIKIIAVAMLLGVLLSACSGIDYNLYGAWRNEDLELTLEFKQNGTLLVSQQGQTQTLNFKFTGPGAVTLTGVGTAAQEAPETKQYAIQGDKMTMTLDEARLFFRLK